MTKSEIIRFLEPFSDEIEFTLGGREVEHLTRPIMITPEYKPRHMSDSAMVQLNIKSTAVVG